MTPEALHAATRDRLRARPLLLLLDVDGTLAPIVARPEDAAVPLRTRATLERLARTPGVHVALVSGRGAADARRVAGLESVLAIGNHGIETLAPSGELTIDPVAAPYREVVAAATRDLEPVAAQHSGCRVENKTWTLSVHYREAAAGAEAPIRLAMERVAAARRLTLTTGKKVFELRPPITVNKGTASVALARALLGDGGSVVYAGDDRTDEDAFRALREAREAVTIRIAHGSSEAPVASAAEFVLADVDAMGAWLELLAADAGPAE